MTLDLLINSLLQLKQNHNLTGEETVYHKLYDFDYQRYEFWDLDPAEYNEKENHITL